MDLTKLRDRGVEHALNLFESGVVFSSLTQNMIKSFSPDSIPYVNGVARKMIYELQNKNRAAIKRAIDEHGKTLEAIQKLPEFEQAVEEQGEYSLEHIVRENVRNLF